MFGIQRAIARSSRPAFRAAAVVRAPTVSGESERTRWRFWWEEVGRWKPELRVGNGVYGATRLIFGLFDLDALYGSSE
jgi:hypothetical protein